MAYKKDINPWLKENGYTWNQMSEIWKECCEVNTKCKMLANSMINWSDLTMSQIKQLPTLKEKTLKQLAEKAEQKAKEEEDKLKEQEDKEFYLEHFEEVILQKIDSCERLTKDELSKLVYEYGLEEHEGDSLRWSRVVTTIVELCGRYFKIKWQRGLTEYQEDTFDNNVEEVFKQERITITRSSSFVASDVKTDTINKEQLTAKLLSLLNSDNLEVIKESDDSIVVKCI